MQYSHVQTIEFNINDDLEPSEWSKKIESMEKLDGGTWTASAIQYSLNNMWSLSQRESRLLIVVTDGQVRQPFYALFDVNN